MQSKMTEREFREKITRLTNSREETTSADDAVEVAREAGFEFAPEPVKLPERLEVYKDGRVGWVEDGVSWTAWEPVEQNSAPVDPAKISEVALLRYNAYPGLREAAQQLLRVLGTMIVAGQTSDLMDAWRAVQAELAKGPK